MFYVRKQCMVTIVNSQIKIKFFRYKVQLCIQKRTTKRVYRYTVPHSKQKDPQLHSCITFVHFMTPLQHFTLSPHTTSVVYKCAHIEIPTNLKLSNPGLHFIFGSVTSRKENFNLH